MHCSSFAKRIGAAAAVSFAFAGTPARAADVAILGGIIIVSGDIKLADKDAFHDAAAKASATLWGVAFISQGGNLWAGLSIGEEIRKRGLATFVPPSSVCASACALAWLGGTHRYAEPTSKIGFHAAFKKGMQTTSGEANAFVGAYLSKLGFSYGAIEYMTKADPAAMTWLTIADAKKYGIDVDPLPKPSAPSPALAPNLAPVTLAATDPAPAPSARKPTLRAGTWILQVGALESEAEAYKRLNEARVSASAQLGEAEQFIEIVDKGDKRLYRARFANLDRDRAEAACKALKRSDISRIAIKI